MNATNHEQSIWEITSHAAKSYSPLHGDIETEICVIGAGITGLTAAILLKQAGRKVVLVEQDRIGAGTSGGTSAHLTNVVDFRFNFLIKSYNLETAQRVASSMISAIDLIEELSSGLGIDCAFKRVPGYYYAEDADGMSQVQQEFDGAERAGLTVRLLDKAPLPFNTVAAFVAERQAQFQPMDYLHGLAKSFSGGDCVIHEQTSVTQVKDGTPCVLTTNRGTIRAQKVVMATHVPLGVNVLQNELQYYRSFVLAARVSDQVPEGLYWDTQDPYHYIRAYERDGERYVIVGGKDHKVGENASADSFTRLEDYARRHFQIIDIAAKWSAQFYDPADSLPFIGKNLFGEHVYIATGYGGDGLTFGTLAGRMTSNLILHGRDEYEDLYRPSRINLTGAPEIFKKSVTVAGHFFGDRVKTPTARKIDTLNLGEGCVVRDGTSYLAVYKEVSGALKTYSAICPHMKCVLHWNEGGKSFDCPCHGSRFDTEGNRVDGPATMQLEKVEWGQGKPPEKQKKRPKELV